MRIRVKCGALSGWYYTYSDKVETEILSGFAKVIKVEELYKLAGDGGHSSCYDGIQVRVGLVMPFTMVPDRLRFSISACRSSP